MLVQRGHTGRASVPASRSGRARIPVSRCGRARIPASHSGRARIPASRSGSGRACRGRMECRHLGGALEQRASCPLQALGWRASAPATGATGVPPVAVGRAPRTRRYGTSTTTLKNLKPALFSSVTVCHSPSSLSAPFSTTGISAPVQRFVFGSHSTFGLPSTNSMDTMRQSFNWRMSATFYVNDSQKIH